MQFAERDTFLYVGRAYVLFLFSDKKRTFPRHYGCKKVYFFVMQNAELWYAFGIIEKPRMKIHSYGAFCQLKIILHSAFVYRSA